MDWRSSCTCSCGEAYKICLSVPSRCNGLGMKSVTYHHMDLVWLVGQEDGQREQSI